MAECLESSILLGFQEKPIKECDNVDWTVNKIGGPPLFSPDISDNSLSKFVENGLRCSTCNEICVFLAQIHSPVDDQPIDRVLYFFACQRQKCDNFVTIRCVTPARETDSPSQPERKWETSQENRWSDSSESEDNARFLINPPESNNQSDHSDEDFDDDVEFDSKVLPVELGKVSMFWPYFIGVDNLEDLEKDKKTSDRSDCKEEEQANDFHGPAENYENVELETIFNNDKLSYKFYKHLRLYPDQIIRYSWKGSPFLNQLVMELDLKDCEQCGSVRTYECQLMPGLIYALRPISVNRFKTPLDFGTVLVFTCSNNCTSNELNLEQCIMLKEPDHEIIEEFLADS